MLLQRFKNTGIEAGCDEAGRGCLAGPVFAAAVILPDTFYHPDLNDSKKINPVTRLRLRAIIEDKALYWAVASVNPKEIDKINILNASFKAMHLAIDQLDVKPDRLLIDGNRFNPYSSIPHHCIIKGDGKYASIAAASIIAKTYRDEYMQSKASTYAQYGWKTNMGYPTLEHRKAIAKYGPTPLHRKSFRWHPDV
ncbi:MAG: ribonuclease HII [Bacteroidia bacterium]|nr:ribonuclease HII [Bacteroidia bacterium]